MKTKEIIVMLVLALALMPPVQAQEGIDIAYLLDITDTSFLPSTIYSGDVVSLAVDIENKGSYLSIINLKATLDIGEQFEPIDLEDTAALIPKDGARTLIFKFRVKEDTTPGYYPANVSFSYVRGDTEMEMSETQQISVPVSNTEKILDVTVEPTVINPGNQTEMSFTITNVGGTAVSNIAFSWSAENNLILPLGSDNKRYVSVISPLDKVMLSYLVAADPNIATGIYPLDISITFTDIDGTKTNTSEVGLILGGETDFEVSAEVVSSGQVSISIANIGSNNAEAVVVKIPSQQGVSVKGSSSSILGNLDKGDFTLANFELRATSMAQRPGQSPGASQPETEQNDNRRTLLVEINYTDTTGERQAVEKELEMTMVFSDTGTASTGTASTPFGQKGIRQSSESNSLLAWMLLVIALAGAIAFNKFKAGLDWKKLAKNLAIVAVLFLASIFFLQSNLAAVLASTLISVGLLFRFFRGNEFRDYLEKVKKMGVGKGK